MDFYDIVLQNIWKKNAVKWNFSWNTQQRTNHENWIIVFMIYFIIWVLRLLVKQRVIFDKFCWKFNEHLLHVEERLDLYTPVNSSDSMRRSSRCNTKNNKSGACLRWISRIGWFCVCFFSSHWKTKETVINHTNGKQMKMNPTIQWPNIHIYTYRMQKSWLLFLINKYLS